MPSADLQMCHACAHVHAHGHDKKYLEPEHNHGKALLYVATLLSPGGPIYVCTFVRGFSRWLIPLACGRGNLELLVAWS